MTEQISTAGDTDEAKHLSSPLMRQTLLNPDLVRPSTNTPVIRMLPWLSIVKVGGRSIMDRGPVAILPLVEEFKRIFRDRRLLIATGAGIRARHVFSVGLDLGLPTGLLATLASSEAEQNGHILAALLAEHGVAYLPHTAVGHQLPFFLSASPAAISNGYPPYGLYEFPAKVGKLPTHRTDSGVFLLADAFGAERLVYVEDVDGIYTADPATDDAAVLIPKATAAEILAMNLKTLPIDRLVLELMASAKHQRELQIVNGLRPGTIARALAGEQVGSVITRD
ncbi:MAG: amino acid kinase family protein [Actinomycetota bacterium]